MYPKSIKINNGDTNKEFLYPPDYHQGTFYVHDIESSEDEVTFDIDITMQSFKQNGFGIEKYENLIGRVIIKNEFINFRE